MLALIDADVLRYEIGFGSQFTDEESGEPVSRDYEFATSLMDEKIRIIKYDTEAEDALLFLTNDTVTHRMKNRQRKRNGLKPKEFIPNFRFDIATTKPYKGQRKKAKPLHYDNLTAYLLENYNVYTEDTGLEADDAMCIIQSQRLREGDTIICSRDKDLRICEGNHYSWECGRANAIGPVHTDKLGSLKLSENRKSIKGYGLRFFYSQLLTGDVVDNIPGLPGCGPVAAYEILGTATSEVGMSRKIHEVYEEKIGNDYEDYLREQVNLLWMVQELDEEGRPVMYKFPEGEEE